MRITDLQVSYLEIPLSEPLCEADIPEPATCYRVFLARIFTDEGLVGNGVQHWYFDQVEFPEWGRYVERAFKPHLLNTVVDASCVEKFADHIRSQAFGIGVSPRPCCVEMALWDVLGKEAGKPIYKMWGAFQERVKAYASVLEPYPLWTEVEWVDFVKRIYKEGFRAVKLHIGWKWKDPARVVDVVAAIRDALGSKLEIMIDAMQGWTTTPLYDLQTAIQYARSLEKYDVRWLEEPLPHFNNPELSSRLCDAVDLDIAGGGAMFGLHTFKTVLEKGALDIVQPDVQFAGGLLETKRIALLAKDYGRLCIPHCWGSGYAVAATLQVLGTTDIPYIEYPYHPPSWTVEARDCLLQEPIKIDENGYVKVPQRPGIGVELNEDNVQRYLKKADN